MRTNEIKHEIYEIKKCYLMWFNVNLNVKQKITHMIFNNIRQKVFFGENIYSLKLVKLRLRGSK